MAFVYNSAYEDWDGSLVVGSLKFNYLERLIFDKNRVVYREKIANQIGRVRDVVLGPGVSISSSTLSEACSCSGHDVSGMFTRRPRGSLWLLNVRT